MEGGSQHMHVPQITVYGLDKETGQVADQMPVALARGRTTFRLVSPNAPPDGVFTTPGFDDYVPNLATLKPTPRGTVREDYVMSEIILPHGNLRARDLVSWDVDVNAPAEVAFMGTTYRGYMANEAVLDIGDDSDYFDPNSPNTFLSVETDTPNIPKALWPLTKAPNYVDATDPNTVEILITNFAAQRRRGVFYTLHTQACFKAVGYDADPSSYENTPQYERFVDAAKAFDEFEWTEDLAENEIGLPFPYILTDSIKPLQPIRPSEKSEVIIDGPPGDVNVRKSGDGVPKVGTAEKHEMATHDPWARPICPIEQDDPPPGT
jgi:hypothetical protein